MNYQSNLNRNYQPQSTQQQSQQQGRPAIRAGLSVQELKAMTAMRMASTGDSVQTPIPTQATLTSSYQTATPQQLQAAGIPAIVINDRQAAATNPRGPRPYRQQSGGFNTSSVYSNEFNSGSLSTNNSNFGSRPSNNDLSPYHQQLLPKRPLNPSNNSFYSDNLSNGREGRGFDSASSRLNHTEQNYFRDNNSMMRSSNNYQSSLMNPSSLDSGLFPETNNFSGSRFGARGSERNFYQNGLLSDPSPRLDGQNGPEVRSPHGSDIFGLPDSESEHYFGLQDNKVSRLEPDLLDSFSNLGILSSDNDLLFDRRVAETNRLPTNHPSKLFNKSMSSSLLQSDNSYLSNSNSVSPLPNAGSNIISPNGSSSLTTAGLNGISVLNSMSPSSGLARDSQLPGSGPRISLMKSKTAPRLGLGIGTTPESPSGSPSMKNLKKSFGHVPDYLASEVAESVLDTPTSNHYFSNNFRFPESNNSNGNKGLNTIELSNTFKEGTFFGDSDPNDSRFEWNDPTANDDEDSPTNNEGDFDDVTFPSNYSNNNNNYRMNNNTNLVNNSSRFFSDYRE